MPSALLPLFSLFFLAYFQSVLPAKIGKAAPRQQAKPTVSRWKNYLATIVCVCTQAGVAICLAPINRLPVFGSNHLDIKTMLWAFGFLVLNLSCTDPLEWKFTSASVKKRIVDFLPHNARERLIWIIVSLATASSEEIVYRAIFFGLLFHLTGIYWVAGVISAMLFAVSHRSYGPIAIGSTFVVGLILQWFVFISGGLFLSISVHFIHNAFALIYVLLEKNGLERGSSAPEQEKAVVVQ